MKCLFYLWMGVMLIAISPSRVMADVNDSGGFFSKETVSQANQSISKIREKYGKDVIVETFPEIPAEKRKSYSPERKNQFYADWLRERAQAKRLDGVFILITKQPSHLQVGVGRKTMQQGFSAYDRDRVRDAMLQHFKKKEYDEGLMAALSNISSTFDEHSKTFTTSAGASRETGSRTGAGEQPVNTSYRRGVEPTTTPAKKGWSWMTWALVLGGGFILLRLISRIFSRPRPSPGAQQYPATQGYGQGPGGYGQPPNAGAGGGGAMRGMFGGLFGGLAGSWLGNRLFGHGSDAPSGGAVPPSQTFDDRQDFGSSGGDFDTGDTGGGGADFGDSGGGFSDGGGSDSGGGGDF